MYSAMVRPTGLTTAVTTQLTSTHVTSYYTSNNNRLIKDRAVQSGISPLLYCDDLGRGVSK